MDWEMNKLAIALYGSTTLAGVLGIMSIYLFESWTPFFMGYLGAYAVIESIQKIVADVKE